jgi:hypothetical protein
MIQIRRIAILSIALLCGIPLLLAQHNQCKIQLKDDVLVLENARIKRTYLWNNGNLITQRIINKQTNYEWVVNNTQPDITFPGVIDSATNTQYRIYVVKQSLMDPFHQCIEIIYSLEMLEIKRVLRLYPDCPAIASDYYFRGKVSTNWNLDDKQIDVSACKTLENLIQLIETHDIVSMENLCFEGKHWKLKTIALMDNTDRFNDLVKESNFLSFRNRLYSGNILIANNIETNQGIFMIKEAPSPMAQLYYPGADFMVEYGHIRMIGVGISNELITPEKWISGYSSVVGVSGPEEYGSYLAAIEYQRKRKQYIPERDEQIMANTWGDRSQDGKVNEQFILKELERSKELGISHLQIDDGWQQGLSHGTVIKTENKKWDSWELEDWEPHKERFPNGFSEIIRSAKEKEIELGLWFNPSKENDYATWKTDADIVVNLYKKYGIKYFKIDGMDLSTKLSEINLIKFLHKIRSETNGNVVFNLDATAGKRFGYLYYSTYGNIFVENRYTDWQNYYPFWTLRNLWMLSKYVPAQNLQIEFLNKWRNSNLYGDDLFAPANYGFDYLFAITMMAQPLAWFETSNLPDDAMEVATTIKTYRKHQTDIHSGLIHPLGDEPSGTSWTGFQSLHDDKGYLLFFRENNNKNKVIIRTMLPSSCKVKLKHILGDGYDYIDTTNENSELSIELSNINSYVLYKYELMR